LVLLMILIDYLNGYVHARSLGIATQIKIIYGIIFNLYLQVSALVSGFGFLRCTRLCQGRRKSLKSSKIYPILLDLIIF
jgi:hypothetical protein